MISEWSWKRLWSMKKICNFTEENHRLKKGFFFISLYVTVKWMPTKQSKTTQVSSSLRKNAPLNSIWRINSTLLWFRRFNQWLSLTRVKFPTIVKTRPSCRIAKFIIFIFGNILWRGEYLRMSRQPWFHPFLLPAKLWTHRVRWGRERETSEWRRREMEKGILTPGAGPQVRKAQRKFT